MVVIFMQVALLLVKYLSSFNKRILGAHQMASASTLFCILTGYKVRGVEGAPAGALLPECCVLVGSTFHLFLIPIQG